jgi:hypothetical protein
MNFKTVTWYPIAVVLRRDQPGHQPANAGGAAELAPRSTWR